MILVDSGFLLAFAQPTDALHWRAVGWAKSVSERLLATEYVLCETVNSLSRRADRLRAHRIVELISSDPNYTLVPASSELFAAGLCLHRDRPDKEWSLTDCVSFHLMRERGLTRALAYDLHFEQAGFEALLRRDPPAGEP
ncbi:MAG: PIN domain-containing protein [Verrucomicrobiota bacterium]|jgi:predicted nucleic acid-binding protein